MDEVRLYQYKPLPTHDSVRILELQPSREIKSPLVCKFVHCQLSKLPRYEALSYTWGDPVFPKTLTVHDRRRLQSPLRFLCGIKTTSIHISHLRLTENLAAALMRYRLRSKARSLWVDALCINQCDRLERERQVAIMSKIYLQARRVLVFTGESSQQMLQALSHIRSIASLAPNFNLHSETDILTSLLNVPVPETILAPGPHDIAVAVVGSCLDTLRTSKFFEQAWFTRIWIVQEVVLGREVLLRCGSEEIEWLEFAKAVAILFRMTVGETHFCRLLSWVWMLVYQRASYLLMGGPSTRNPAVMKYLWAIPSSHLGRGCSDDRDRVFAILGLDQNDSVNVIQSDYSSSVSGVYTAFAKAMLKRGSFAVLGHAGVWNRCSSDHTVDENSASSWPGDACPSWVPEYRLSRLENDRILEWEHKLSPRQITQRSKHAKIRPPRFEGTILHIAGTVDVEIGVISKDQ
jgi:hypothetical protein